MMTFLRKKLFWVFLWLVSIVLVSPVAGLRAQSPDPDRGRHAGVLSAESRYEHYCSYTPGDAPFIISIPHDGTLAPEDCIRRTRENVKVRSFVTERDTRTMELGFAVARIFYEKTGKRPFVVFTDARRLYVDQNRAPAGAVPRGPDGKYHPANKAVYDAYHRFMKSARTDLLDRFPTGLMIDFHAHAHGRRHAQWNRVEIGYCIGRSSLTQSDAELNASGTDVPGDAKNRISIRHLIGRTPDMQIADLLFGPYSYGEMLYDGGRGLPCLPRAAERAPLEAGAAGNPDPDAEPYFNGGFISRTYGSSNESLEGSESRIDAIQLEFDGRARLPENIEATAEQVVRATVAYLTKFYGFTPR